MTVPFSFLRSWAEWLQSSSKSQYLVVHCSVMSTFCAEGAADLDCHPVDDDAAADQSDLRHLPELEEGADDQLAAGLLHMLEGSESGLDVVVEELRVDPAERELTERSLSRESDERTRWSRL